MDGLPALSQLVRAHDAVGTVTEDVFRFSCEGAPWWGGIVPFEIGDVLAWIGVALPESEVAAEFDDKKYAVLVGGVLALLLAGGLGATMTREYIRSLRHAQDASLLRCSEDALADRIKAGESDTLEFKSTLRWNLKSDKPDKRIELAWLKNVVAFLNSDGGAVLIGVTDDCEILDMAADRFANEDKYLLHITNLLDRHIGTEFSPFVSCGIRSIEERRLAVIECRRAAMPAFLKDGEDEAFYIRMGPASRRLPTSQVLEYVKTRGA